MIAGNSTCWGMGYFTGAAPSTSIPAGLVVSSIADTSVYPGVALIGNTHYASLEYANFRHCMARCFADNTTCVAWCVGATAALRQHCGSRGSCASRELLILEHEIACRTFIASNATCHLFQSFSGVAKTELPGYATGYTATPEFTPDSSSDEAKCSSCTFKPRNLPALRLVYRMCMCMHWPGLKPSRGSDQMQRAWHDSVSPLASAPATTSHCCLPHVLLG